MIISVTTLKDDVWTNYQTPWLWYWSLLPTVSHYYFAFVAWVVRVAHSVLGLTAEGNPAKYYLSHRSSPPGCDNFVAYDNTFWWRKWLSHVTIFKPWCNISFPVLLCSVPSRTRRLSPRNFVIWSLNSGGYMNCIIFRWWATAFSIAEWFNPWCYISVVEISRRDNFVLLFNKSIVLD